MLARFALRLLVWTHAIDLGKVLLRWVIGRYPNLLSPAFQFTERMHGYVSTRPVARDEHAAPSRERIATDFDKAAAWGRAADTPLSFELTIRTENLHNLTENSSHCAAIIGAESHPGLPPGTVICRALSQEPMRVLRGQVNLLPVDPQRVETWSMTYDMVLEREGGPVRFQGFKVLHQQPGSHWWDDVTTLFITLHAGERGEGGLLAQGTLKLNLEDLMWQGASGRLDSARGKFADLVNRIPAADDAIKMLYMAKFAGFSVA